MDLVPCVEHHAVDEEVNLNSSSKIFLHLNDETTILPVLLMNASDFTHNLIINLKVN